MDGVLLLSSDIHFRAFKETVLEEGIIVDSYGPIAGMRTDLAMEQLFQSSDKKLPPELKSTLVERKRRIARRLLEIHPPVAPGCHRVLSALKKRGHTLGLASSASVSNVDLFLSASGTRSLFGVVLCGDDVFHAKPDPEIYLKAADRLGMKIENCLVVEDSENGIISARRAGAGIIGFEGEHSAEELLELGAQRIVACLDDLLVPEQFN